MELNMDPGRAALVICITIVIVIGINAAIYATYRRGKGPSTIDMFRTAARTARDPWKSEADALEELSQLTAQFKGDRMPEQKDDNKKPDQ
jgi:hypothetical protein